MTGKVVNIVRKTPTVTGGYFFIQDEHGSERFAHHTALVNVKFKELKEQATVEFDPIDAGSGKLRAEQVRVVA